MTSEEHVGHMIADDAYLALLAHVDVVDKASCRQSLWQLVDKSRQHTIHLILVGQFPLCHILVAGKADGTE